MTRAAVLYVFRTLVDDEIPLNAGCLKPLDVVIPEGCMLRPRYPAAVVAGWLGSTGHRENIENPDYRVIGMGAAATGDGVVLVDGGPLLDMAVDSRGGIAVGTTGGSVFVSDDDGESWTPAGNMCSGPQFDHQSIGSGPWSSTSPDTPISNSALPR